MSNLKSYNKYSDIVDEFRVFIVKTNKNKYEIKLAKRLDGDKPPKITLVDLATKIDNLEWIVVQDHNLLQKIIKLNNLKTK